MYNEMYGLDKPVKSFAIANQFVETMNKGCYELGKALKPFCFFPNDVQEKYGVIDLSAFDGLVDAETKLIPEVAEFRRKQYSGMGFGALPYTAELEKLLFIDYLMSVSICYIEIPKWITKNGVSQRSFDKCLVTKNPRIMATWMGCSEQEMQAKYSSRIASNPADFAHGELRAVKLNQSSKGNSIVCPRNIFDTKEMSCTPLFMTYAFMMGAFAHMGDKIVQFTYLKDNGTERKLATTISRDILMDYYHDVPLVDGMLGGTDMFSVEQGGLKLSSKQGRGYVRVPELGSSRYDATGVRALNLTRILKAEIIPEVDRTFIDVDLASAVANFDDCLDHALSQFPEKMLDIYNALGVQLAEGVAPPTTPATALEVMKNYAKDLNTILSTSFQRDLHLFMIQHPEWFPLYTGKPNAGVAVASSASFGVGTMDF